MREDLVDVYEAATLMEARLFADRLEEEGIRSFIDDVDSPFDGLTAARQEKRVRVLPADAEAARRLAEEFEAEAAEGAEGGEESELPGAEGSEPEEGP